MAKVQQEFEWNSDTNLTNFMVYRHIHENRGENIALVYKDLSLSYSEVYIRVAIVASKLEGLGVQEGDYVILSLHDSVDFVVAFFAILSLGGVAVPVNSRAPVNYIRSIISRINAKIFISNEEASVLSKCSLISHQSESGEGFDWIYQDPEFNDYSNFRVKKTNKPAYCLFSSGTTGTPKGILHRHSDILHCIEAYSLAVLKMRSDDRVLAVPKLSFGYGLGGNLLSTFFVGGTSILLDQPSNGRLMIEASEKYKPTLFLGQPRAISQILESKEVSGFKNLRLAVSAGETLGEALYHTWKENVGCELLDGFGTTEVGHVFISNSINRIAQNSPGYVVEPFRIDIRDELGNSLPQGTVGNLWVSGPSISPGFLDQKVKWDEVFQNGWIKTGDLVSINENGSVNIVGRADEMIKAGCGQWVSPYELESILCSDNQVLEAAIVGDRDEFGVISPKAYVVLRDDVRPSLEIECKLKSLVALRFPMEEHKHLGSLEFILEIPKTPTGKIQRYQLETATLTEFSYDC